MISPGAHVCVYIYKEEGESSFEEESRWIRLGDKTGSELLIVPVFDLRSYNGLIELPPVALSSPFFFSNTLVDDNQDITIFLIFKVS